MVDDALTRSGDWTSPWSRDAGPRSTAPRTSTDGAELACFDAFFFDARAPMLRLAYMLTGSLSQAEEVVQESFVRVYERWSTIDEPGAYLRRAVVNRCTSWHRHRAVVRRADANLARAEIVLDQPDETAELAETAGLAAALAQLPRRRRAVVVLRFYEQLELGGVGDSVMWIGLPAEVAVVEIRQGDQVFWQQVVDRVAAFPLADRRPSDEYVALDDVGNEVMRTTWSTVSLLAEAVLVGPDGRNTRPIQMWSSTFATTQSEFMPEVDPTVLEGMTQADEEAYRAFADAQMRSCLARDGDAAWNACLVSTDVAVKAYLADRP